MTTTSPQAPPQLPSAFYEAKALKAWHRAERGDYLTVDPRRAEARAKADRAYAQTMLNLRDYWRAMGQ